MIHVFKKNVIVIQYIYHFHLIKPVTGGTMNVPQDKSVIYFFF